MAVCAMAIALSEIRYCCRKSLPEPTRVHQPLRLTTATAQVQRAYRPKVKHHGAAGLLHPWESKDFSLYTNELVYSSSTR